MTNEEILIAYEKQHKKKACLSVEYLDARIKDGSLIQINGSTYILTDKDLNGNRRCLQFIGDEKSVYDYCELNKIAQISL